MSCLAMERLKQLISRYSLQKSHLGRHSDSVKVTFVNLCGENISIHWVDYDGEDVEYFSVDEVRPEERYVGSDIFLLLHWLFLKLLTRIQSCSS